MVQPIVESSYQMQAATRKFLPQVIINTIRTWRNEIFKNLYGSSNFSVVIGWRCFPGVWILVQKNPKHLYKGECIDHKHLPRRFELMGWRQLYGCSRLLETTKGSFRLQFDLSEILCPPLKRLVSCPKHLFQSNVVWLCWAQQFLKHVGSALALQLFCLA